MSSLLLLFLLFVIKRCQRIAVVAGEIVPTESEVCFHPYSVFAYYCALFSIICTRQSKEKAVKLRTSGPTHNQRATSSEEQSRNSGNIKKVKKN